MGEETWCGCPPPGCPSCRRYRGEADICPRYRDRHNKWDTVKLCSGCGVYLSNKGIRKPHIDWAAFDAEIVTLAIAAEAAHNPEGACAAMVPFIPPPFIVQGVPGQPPPMPPRWPPPNTPPHVPPPPPSVGRENLATTAASIRREVAQLRGEVANMHTQLGEVRDIVHEMRDTLRELRDELKSLRIKYAMSFPAASADSDGSGG